MLTNKTVSEREREREGKVSASERERKLLVQTGNRRQRCQAVSSSCEKREYQRQDRSHEGVEWSWGYKQRDSAR